MARHTVMLRDVTRLLVRNAAWSGHRDFTREGALGVDVVLPLRDLRRQGNQKGRPAWVALRTATAPIDSGFFRKTVLNPRHRNHEQRRQKQSQQDVDPDERDVVGRHAERRPNGAESSV